MSIVEPFGEDRADMRAALNSLFQKCTEPESVEEIYRELTNYTGEEDEDPDQLPVDERALAAIKEQA